MPKKRFRKREGCDSQQEIDFRKAHPAIAFHPDGIAYTQDLCYMPDAKLGVTANGYHVYLELKEYMPHDECAKYEAVVNSNPRRILCMLIAYAEHRTFNRLRKHPRINVHHGYTTLPDEWLRLDV